MDAGRAATASDIVMIITTRQYPAGPAEISCHTGSHRCQSSTEVMDSPVRAEISKYMGMSDMGDALDFWKRNTGDLPLLSAIARVYLALSPGSVPVEQLFSTAGLILNGKRSQLSPFRMDMICFVHDNYKLV